ncbi:MAG: hypothetical protein P1U39_04755 [Legionellaceae bacterium]|nr:hypothetical protein [Legionellaceae bacterium]
MTNKPEDTARLNARKKALKEEYDKQLREIEQSKPTISPLATHEASQDQGIDESTALDVDTKDPEALIKAYNLIAKNDDGTYKDGFCEVKVNPDGSRFFKFPSPEEAGDFFEARAKEGHVFELRDAQTKELIAASKGDGQMYRPDGTVFGPGEFKQALKDIDENRKNDEQSMSPMI